MNKELNCNVCKRELNLDKDACWKCQDCHQFYLCQEHYEKEADNHIHDGLKMIRVKKEDWEPLETPSCQADFYKKVFARYSDRGCIGVRTLLEETESTKTYGSYSWYTYKEVFDRSMNIGCGLRSLLRPSKNERPLIGVCSVNNAEMLMLDFACSIKALCSFLFTQRTTLLLLTPFYQALR